MIAELISVGTELLLGNILNSNAKYLSEQCSELGLSVYFQTVVGDNPNRLEEVLKQGIQRSDVIILTGGLGPTQDDITKEIVAKVVNKKLIKDHDTEKKLNLFFEKRKVKMSHNNLKQAYVPEGSMVLDNHNGTAPGLIVKDETGKKSIILLPGPPKELIPLFEEQVKPYIKEKSHYTIVSEVIKIVGLGESLVEEKVLALIEKQTNPTIAPYAKDGEVHLRITSRTKTLKEGKALIEPTKKEIYNLLGQHIYSSDGRTLEEVVVDLLIEKNYSLSVAESCSGGLLSGRLINCSGISSVYKEGIITYSNESKIKLGVKKETIDAYGSVSEETAKEMAQAIATRAQSDVALSITGIAGPNGGTKEKPVGLVYIACHIHGKTIVEKINALGSRDKIRNFSVISAINLLRKELLKKG
ncbi:competence/damage-inducible protein cinA [Natranaerovirga hydrolytica]|uniref:Putative competence-damage inducible protein n=1 Tax=Natranaerovirga hydrolytica TaxID=680378 RepID=A0A4R1MXG6_9FIRM|nr:competence/damage-inducible protein A [Natranaerovirga hydrolytica]TCK97958.1 competence/damage-inducible protein cinA [Natranaerovirga hydrolytica]